MSSPAVAHWSMLPATSADALTTMNQYLVNAEVFVANKKPDTTDFDDGAFVSALIEAGFGGASVHRSKAQVSPRIDMTLSFTHAG